MMVTPGNGQNTEQNNRRLLEIVRTYADAMIEKDRDVYGKEYSSLFAAEKHRILFLSAAEQYLSASPEADNIQKPDAFAYDIE